MKNTILLIFLYAFWFSVFFCIYWLSREFYKWDKLQQLKQKHFKESQS